MSLTQQESNFVSRIQQLADKALTLRHEIQEEIALYNAEAFGTTITDSDLQEVSAFKHITQAEMVNTITALSAIITSLGDDSSGQAINLIKLKG